MSYLNYDINLLYQSIANTIASLWPIVAPGFAIMLVTLVLSGLVSVLSRWIDDRR